MGLSIQIRFGIQTFVVIEIRTLLLSKMINDASTYNMAIISIISVIATTVINNMILKNRILVFTFLNRVFYINVVMCTNTIILFEGLFSETKEHGIWPTFT